MKIISDLQKNSSSFKEEYVQDFVDKWDQLINWDYRSRGEKDFFLEILNAYGVVDVLDVATGTGYHSIKLLQGNFNVTSIDGSSLMLNRAVKNARSYGLELEPICVDWQELGNVIKKKFDAIICLGSSFPHLFNEKDRLKVLSEFHSALSEGGF